MSTLATPALSDAARHTLAAINAARHQPTPMLSAIAPGIPPRKEGLVGVRSLWARAFTSRSNGGAFPRRDHISMTRKKFTSYALAHHLGMPPVSGKPTCQDSCQQEMTLSCNSVS